ncbi:MAG: histidine phosphatase family protein, partial [Pyrinomonadaceae bacterium]
MIETNGTSCLRLYLIRHGEVEGSCSGRVLGWTDTPLSETGVEQAHELRDSFASLKLSAVYSSDLQRARKTAETIAESHSLEVRATASWREINMGDWEECAISSLHERVPKMVTQLFEDPASFQYPSGESFKDFISRIKRSMDQLLCSHDAGVIVLVTHGGVCRAIIGEALGIPMKNWLRLSQDYGCVN